MLKRTIAFLAILSVVLGFGYTGKLSYADYGYGDTQDQEYYFSNLDSNGYSYYRFKYNYSRVYVNPQSGPMIKYEVYAAFTNSGSGQGSVSGKYAIPTNTQASITNTALNSGRPYVRLRFERMVAIMNQTTWGWWSPDSTQNYTIYGE